MIAAGRLRHRVALQEQTTTLDAAGTALQTWPTVVTRWAAVEPISGREYYLAQERHAEVTTRITMRHCPAARERMRAVYAGRWYDIVSVIDVDEKHEDTVLMCNLLKEKPL